MRGGVKNNLRIIFLISQQQHYVVTPYKNRLNEMVQMRGHSICSVRN